MLTNAVKNFLGYYSPRYLFFSGGTQYQFSQPGFGVLNPILLPFFYWGIFQLYRRRQWFVLLWLFLSPIPAAITRDQYAVIRATTMIPAVYLSVSLGLISFLNFLKTRRLSLVFPILVLILWLFSPAFTLIPIS